MDGPSMISSGWERTGLPVLDTHCTTASAPTPSITLVSFQNFFAGVCMIKHWGKVGVMAPGAHGYKSQSFDWCCTGIPHRRDASAMQYFHLHCCWGCEYQTDLSNWWAHLRARSEPSYFWGKQQVAPPNGIAFGLATLAMVAKVAPQKAVLSWNGMLPPDKGCCHVRTFLQGLTQARQNLVAEKGKTLSLRKQNFVMQQSKAMSWGVVKWCCQLDSKSGMGWGATLAPRLILWGVVKCCLCLYWRMSKNAVPLLWAGFQMIHLAKCCCRAGWRVEVKLYHGHLQSSVQCSFISVYGCTGRAQMLDASLAWLGHWFEIVHTCKEVIHEIWIIETTTHCAAVVVIISTQVGAILAAIL